MRWFNWKNKPKHEKKRKPEPMSQEEMELREKERKAYIKNEAEKAKKIQDDIDNMEESIVKWYEEHPYNDRGGGKTRKSKTRK